MAQRPVVNANRARYSPLVHRAEFYPPSNNDYVDGEARFSVLRYQGTRAPCTRYVTLRKGASSCGNIEMELN